MKCGSVAFIMCMILPRSSAICRSGMILTPSIICALPRSRAAPAQSCIELSAREQILEPFETDEFPAGEMLAAKPDLLEAPVEIRRALFRGPVKLKIRERARELAEVGLVGALIGAASRLELDHAAGHRARHDLGEIEDPVIERVGAGV